MGRRNKEYAKNLHQQAYDKLVSMQAFGESKQEAVANGTADDKIFSFNTWKTYWKHTKYFIRYVEKEHPECPTLKKARKYANEWLQCRVDQGLSAWTVQTEAKALGKLFGIRPDDKDYFQPPVRKRAEIKRSRQDCARDQHFSEANNDELIKFCRGTGLRRSELVALKGKDLFSAEQIRAWIADLEAKADPAKEEQEILHCLYDSQRFAETEYFIFVRQGKGGRKRFSPVLEKYQKRIVERMQETGEEEAAWLYVNSNADIHAYRADYAGAIYKAHARAIEDIPFDKINKGTGRKYQSEVYACRRDEAGKKLDKAAMLLCSKALGHNRLNIVADHYIRNL